MASADSLDLLRCRVGGSQCEVAPVVAMAGGARGLVRPAG